MFKCDFCDKTYTQKYNKLKHERKNNCKNIKQSENTEIKTLLKEFNEIKEILNTNQHVTTNITNNITNNITYYNFDKLNSFDIMFKELNDINKVNTYFLQELPNTQNMSDIIINFIKQTGNECPIKTDSNNQIVLYIENTGKIVDYEGNKLSTYVSKSAATGYVFCYSTLSSNICNTIATTKDNKIMEENIVIHHNGNGILPPFNTFHKTYEKIFKFKLKPLQLRNIKENIKDVKDITEY